MWPLFLPSPDFTPVHWFGALQYDCYCCCCYLGSVCFILLSFHVSSSHLGVVYLIQELQVTLNF